MEIYEMSSPNPHTVWIYHPSRHPQLNLITSFNLKMWTANICGADYSINFLNMFY